tara:strand:+ start:196 stop:513 length:318 start_codon:yes stop_codon:yes gene_type:complete
MSVFIEGNKDTYKSSVMEMMNKYNIQVSMNPMQEDWNNNIKRSGCVLWSPIQRRVVSARSKEMWKGKVIEKSNPTSTLGPIWSKYDKFGAIEVNPETFEWKIYKF